MKHQIYNKLGQIVGEYDDITKIYSTIRDKRKGEIFIKKNWFGGKYIKTPVAIDKAILDTLIKFGCKSIQILILGVSNQSYVVSFNPQWIKDNGRIINYDVIKQGRNITHFGTQIVWEMDDGLIGGSKQTLLKN